MKKFTTVLKTFVFLSILWCSYVPTVDAQVDLCGNLLHFQILENGQLTWYSNNVKPVRYKVVYLSSNPLRSGIQQATNIHPSSSGFITKSKYNYRYWFLIQANCMGESNHWFGSISNGKYMYIDEINLDKIEICCNASDDHCNCSAYEDNCNLCELVDAILNGKKATDVTSMLDIRTFPNPVSNYSNIEYTLADDKNVSLSIYNISGQKIAQLINDEWQVANNYQRTFDFSNLTAGIYFYVLETAGEQQMLKVIKY